MRLCEIAHNTYHKNIKPWTIRAKAATLDKIHSLLQDESKRDPKWFINKRGSRLRQLVDEIFTLTLEEVSDGTWSEADFEGHDHSDLISQTINEIVSLIEPVYHKLRTDLISANLQTNRAKQQPNQH